MMSVTLRSGRASAAAMLLLTFLVAGWPAGAAAQQRGTPDGEWRYWGGDAWSSRFSSLDQINASNFADLEVAWVWRGDNFGPSVNPLLRATPIYAEGKLFTVAGTRRTVAAIDPVTGETLWTFREPQTVRWERSMRQDYGKGVAYDVVDGRGRIYVVTAAFFLHALDAETGRPVASFGRNGVVDLLADLGYPYDPETGIPEEIGYITNSSPPIVVNGTVIVGNSAEQGYYQTRKEYAAGNVLAYDGRTGAFSWKFNVIPKPGEFGHETWLNDAWSYTGNVSSWAPMSADLERNIVYIPTDPPTNDYFGGFRPGDGLFGTSILALDAATGRRVWHFQIVKHDIWNYDNPTAPSLVNINVNGRRIPALVQTTKQSFAYVFNRETGDPVWPIVDRPVPQSRVPGEHTAATQPFPTLPAAYEMQGLTHDDLIDFTPALRQRAIELLRPFEIGPLFTPPAVPDPARGIVASVHCPGANGGTNIPGGTVVDVESGIMYVASVKGCTAPRLLPGTEVDPDATMDWVTRGPGGLGAGPEGLPFFKPPYGRITAIDLNSGETLWWIPNGDTPDNIRNHPALQGLDIPPTGKSAHAVAIVTRSLLMFGEGRGGSPLFHAVDKRTGQNIASITLPAQSQSPPMTFMHGGRQYIVMAIGGGNMPGSLVALRLP
jgi:glucose dehydrogenase